MPKGFENGTQACRLNKRFYSLKQAGRLWAVKLQAKLQKYEYRPLAEDQSVYSDSDLNITILTYVDDLLLIGPSSKALSKLKKQLQTEFKLRT